MSGPTTPGWVYVLASTSKPGVVKIGKTTRNAIGRARELGREGGYAGFGPFTEVLSRPVSDCGHVESAVHRMLAHRRVRVGRSTCRELFRVDADEACRVVEAAAGSLRRLPGAAPRRRRGRAQRAFWGVRLRGRTLAAAVVLLALLWLLDGPQLAHTWLLLGLGRSALLP